MLVVALARDWSYQNFYGHLVASLAWPRDIRTLA
jgi:hypothetical protein